MLQSQLQQKAEKLMRISLKQSLGKKVFLIIQEMLKKSTCDTSDIFQGLLLKVIISDL